MDYRLFDESRFEFQIEMPTIVRNRRNDEVKSIRIYDNITLL